MKFGVEIPTCTSGMMHPVPFASARDVVDIAREAEQLGFYDAGGNDHLSTMRFVRRAWATPPDYHGDYVRFEDVESFPKPVQSPLPIYSGGNVEGSIKRAARLCQGWLPAKLSPDRIRSGRARLDEHARAAGRDPSSITTALQSIVCLGDTSHAARDTFLNSSFDLFPQSLSNTMTKGVDLDTYLDLNLVGTPDEVCAKIAEFAAAGVDHFCALLFVGNTVEEMRAQIRTFARRVIPAFPDQSAA